MKGEITDAEAVVDGVYRRVDYTVELENGERFKGVFYPARSNCRKISDKALREMAEKLPGTPVEISPDELHGGTTLGHSIGFRGRDECGDDER